MAKTLHATHHPLASEAKQLEFLNNGVFQSGSQLPFQQHLKSCGHWPLKASELEIFQVNLGYMCNQTCKHCHVDAGPDRKEIMTRETLELCLSILEEHQIPTVDLTGGAPEMNPNFQWFVESLRKIGVKEIIVRSNLTILEANKKFKTYPEFFAKNQLRVVSSLPYYSQRKTDRQRGDGVFLASIEALKKLNRVGYGKQNSGLILDLVYNPSGAFLPGDQGELEREFKKALMNDFQIEFNSLFTITNLPISRFLDYLIASDNYEEYMTKLIESFNPAAVEGLMCRNTISVDWKGYLYDCDFNQMLGIKTDAQYGQHVSEFQLDKINQREIEINQHCFGCTAGAGSSCQGTVV